MIDIDRLKALHEAATAAPWERDSEYDGDAIATSYEGCTSGYHNFFIGADVGGKWRTLLDTVNSDHKLIEDDRDENGGHSWDTIGEANTSLLVFLRNAVPSIIDMADRLTRYEAALREIYDLPGELNMSNYDESDVDELNCNFVSAILIAEKALGDTQ